MTSVPAPCEVKTQSDRDVSRVIDDISGTSRRNCMSDGFPEPEVIAAFPGFTPLSATFDWVADPGSFLGKRVENWQYVYHLDFEPPRLGEKRHGSFTAYMAVDYDRVDFERDIKPYKR